MWASGPVLDNDDHQRKLNIGSSIATVVDVWNHRSTGRYGCIVELNGFRGSYEESQLIHADTITIDIAEPALKKLVYTLGYIIDNYSSIDSFGMPSIEWYKSALEINRLRLKDLRKEGALSIETARLCNITWNSVKKYYKEHLV
jgi:hypothetical protein